MTAQLPDTSAGSENVADWNTIDDCDDVVREPSPDREMTPAQEPLECQDDAFNSSDDDVFLADASNPNLGSLNASTGVPSRLRKTVSFRPLPIHSDTTVNSSVMTGTSSNEATEDHHHHHHHDHQRSKLMRASKSLPRLDLSTGLLQYPTDENHGNQRDAGTGNTNATNLPVLREQKIQAITNVVPAGEGNTRNASKLWSKLRQSVVVTNNVPSESVARQDVATEPISSGKETIIDDNIKNENATLAPLGNATTTTTTTDTTAKQIHHYRIRSRHASDPSFWMVQTEMVANVISRYVTWTYRSSFYVTILSSYVVFMGMMILFALGIYISGRMQPTCIFVGDSNVFSGDFMDALQLSWTTLATVGYGIVGPEIPDTNRRCIVVNMLMAFESFLGVLFGGFASAIIIGKMARFQSIAHIHFSDKICVKYGTAAALDDDDDSVTELDANDQRTNVSATEADANNHPFPILEFRMINLLSRERGGEILNAHVSVVASVLYNDCETTHHIESLKVRNASSHPSNMLSMATETTTQAAKMVGSVGAMAAVSTVKLTGAALTCAKNLTTGGTASSFHQLVQQVRRTYPNLDYTSSQDSEDVQRVMDLMISEPRQDIQKNIYVDEGNATLAPPRTYHKLQVETDRHPYFKRVWNIRHILDENSPILNDQARYLIRSNNGQWPTTLSNAESIRKYIRFNDIIVSFSGTSNASGRTVYSQKVYMFSDICIGYTFSNILVLDNHRIVVDMNMINEIREQIGGGAEPLPKSDPVDENILVNAVKNIGTVIEGTVR